MDIKGREAPTSTRKESFKTVCNIGISQFTSLYGSESLVKLLSTSFLSELSIHSFVDQFD